MKIHQRSSWHELTSLLYTVDEVSKKISFKGLRKIKHSNNFKGQSSFRDDDKESGI